MSINGQCACGRVTFRIEGKLRDAASCHCSMCRKMTGSQSSAYALLEPKTFAWLTGEDKLRFYESAKAMGTHFCQTCGSTLCGTYQGEIAWVSLGNIEGDPGVIVESHIFMGSKAPWETNPSDVKQFDEFADVP